MGWKGVDKARNGRTASSFILLCTSTALYGHLVILSYEELTWGGDQGRRETRKWGRMGGGKELGLVMTPHPCIVVEESQALWVMVLSHDGMFLIMARDS